MHFWKFLRPSVLKIIFFLIVSYFFVPVFSQPSLCLDKLAENPYDITQPSYKVLPCIKLTTIAAHFQPLYVTENSIFYQKNAVYYYDLATRYYAPFVYIVFVYLVSSFILYGFTIALRQRDNSFSKKLL